MVDTTDFFTSDSPYAKAKENEDFAQECQIEAVGTDEYQDDSFVYVKVSDLDKPIRLNKTNGRTLVGAFGQESDDWVGRRVFVGTRTYNMDSGEAIGWTFTPIKKQAQNVPDDKIPF